jgi:SAM-dependent methyltransferase
VTNVLLRARSGAVVADGHAWTRPVAVADDRLLQRVDGPVIDIGCGPGRHVLALARLGTVTLGIDVSRPAVDLARRRGAPVLERSIFARVPAAGRWGTALLLDGNLGIGGDPETLLARTVELLRPGGRILVEPASPGRGCGRELVRFEAGGDAGPWFEWTHVDDDDLEPLARRCGLSVRERWRDGGRWFAWLE